MEDGLYLFNPKNNTYRSFTSDENDPYRISSNNINRIVMDHHGNIWLGTTNGLSVVDTLNFRFSNFTLDQNSIGADDIRSLCIDKKGQIWIGTRNQGLYVIKSKSKKANKYSIINYRHNPDDESSIANGTILSLMEDIITKMGQVLTHKSGKKKINTKQLLQSLENLIISFSSDLGKNIKFDYKNFKTNIIPTKYHLLIKEVLIQLIRNSISHGIETPEERKHLKKPETGIIKISTFKKNGSIGFRLKDDGRGIQINKLKETAIKSGKWSTDEINSWDDKQIAELIFTSGISTTDNINMIAGRGVGMDGVKYRIQEYQGKINVNFSEGKYCEFEILLPLVA